MAANGLQPDRVVEILVTRSGALPDRRGSGYRVVAEVVLTAAHVVAGATSLRVRCNADRPDEWTAVGEVLWSDATTDLALIGIPERPGEAEVLPVAFGRIVDRDGVLPVSAMGFPRFKLRADHDAPRPSTYRDSVHAIGSAAVYSNRRQGTLAMTVPAPEYDPDPSRSPWEGMSGAAVWSGGALIGVVTEHHSSDGLATITANRADRWLDRLDADQAERLHALIGFPADARGLVPVAAEEDPAVRTAGERRRALHALMQAESRAFRQHPYRMPTDAPRLDRVYVEPSVIPLPDPAEGPRTTADAEPVPVSEAFARHELLLIQGEPGQGKSTVVKHIAGTLADAWLASEGGARPAVRVPAVDLAGDAPVASLLRDSVTRRHGAGLLQEVPETMFASTVGGTPWLLLVDGLDEIADPATRRRVVDAVAAHAGAHDAPYRWAVTTRPNPIEAIRPLLDAGFSRVALSPFDDAQLASLADRWCADAPAVAEEFLSRFAGSPAAQLIRAPLLATIALVLYRRDPQGRPAYGRPAMYQEFVTYLLGGREGEQKRQEFLRRTVAEGGGSAALAEWLLRSRAQLLTHLAEQTLAGGRRLRDLAVAWTARHAPEPVDFLHDWPQAIASLLAGTGLLVDDRELGDFQWLHRSFAEYLAARSAAAQLPDDWPGERFDSDPTIKAALLGTGGDVPLLTMAVWAARPGAAAEPLLDALLRRSGGYRVYSRKPKTFIRIGADSNEADYYAALAGHLVAEGIPVTDSAGTQVLQRLVERAQSIFHGREFCTILAAQPHREPALAQLEGLAVDPRQPMQARAAAVVAITRMAGWAAAAYAAESLLQPVGSAQWVRLWSNGSITVARVDDARVIAAEQLIALGTVAHEAVRAILQALEFGPGHDAGRAVAAEAWLALGASDRAIALVRPAGRNDNAANLAVSGLLRAGETTTAERIADGLLERVDAGDAGALHDLGTIAEEAPNIGAANFALRIATTVHDRLGHERPPWSDLVRARLGDSSPAIAQLRRPDGGRPAHWSWYDWAHVVEALHRHGRPDAADEAISALIRNTALDGETKSVIGTRLVGLADRRASELCLSAAADEECPTHLRVEAAEALLDTPDHDSAVHALRGIARASLDVTRGSSELAGILVRLGYMEEAVELLDREVTDSVTGYDEHIWSTRRTDAIEALEIIAASQARALLRKLADDGAVAPRACIDIAEAFDGFGDADRALGLARRFVAEHAPVPDRWAAGDATWEYPGGLVRASRLLYRLDDHETVAEACRHAVWWAAGGSSDLDSVVAAVDYLDEIDRLDPEVAALVRAICANLLQDPQASLAHYAQSVIQLIQVIARRGA